MTDLKRPGYLQPCPRHTAATLGYLHTGDLRAVQELLGHAGPRMTVRHAHVVDMAEKNPARFIPVSLEKVGEEHSSARVGHNTENQAVLGIRTRRRK